MNNSFIIRWHCIFWHPFYFIRKGLYKSIKKKATQINGNLLDFGCGNKPYKDLFSNATTYTGVDIEVSGHSHKNEQIDVFYNGKTLPFPNNSFYSIFSSEVVEHVFNIEEILEELHRVLKPGGKLLFTCPFVWPEHEIPYDFARYSSYGIKTLVERKGFTILQQEKTGHFVEVVIQQIVFYCHCMFARTPKFSYFILYQFFILPLNLLGEFLNVILPSKLKRKDLYHNNVLLLLKSN
jgi:SAM-dependent methyltransferase